MTTETIKAKIQKIMALAERAGTEAEGQAAMAAVQALLAKHNLNMSEVQSYDATPQEQIVLDDSVPAPLRNFDWQGLIYSGIAKLYFCDYFRRKKNGQHTFVITGRPSNIAIVHHVAAAIIRMGDAEAKRQMRIEGQRMADDGITLNTRAWANSFRLGFGARIRERCRADIEAAQNGHVKDAETGNALVLAPLYNQERQAIQSFWNKSNLRVVSRNVGAGRSTSGYQAGHAAGNSANLRSNGVTGGARAMIA